MTTTKRTIEIDAEIDAALSRVAEAAQQSPSKIIESALVTFLNDAAENEEDARRWNDYLRTGEKVPVEAIKAWVESWDTDKELPAPLP